MDEIAQVIGTATAATTDAKATVPRSPRYERIHPVDESHGGLERVPWGRLEFTVARAPAGVSYLQVPTIRAQEVGRLAECNRQLEELRELEHDWDSYGAAPPNDVALSLATKVLRYLGEAGLPAPCINPSAEEGVCMSFRSGDLYADIECFNSGEVVAATLDALGKQHVWDVAFSQPEMMQTVRLIRTHLNSANS